MAKILLVDDDSQSLQSTQRILQLAGHIVETAVDGQEALEKIRPSAEGGSLRFDVVVTDVRMPRLGGLEFLRALSLYGETTPVILMTAFGRVEDAVWAMKLGAVDFLTKPFKRKALLDAVNAVLERTKATVETSVSAELAASQGGGGALDAIVGRSKVISDLKGLIERVGPTAASVLVSGESGTGKELVARALHALSPRASGPFVALNCAAVPEQLIESELFGFEKGAFTGATAAKTGLFHAAHGGTLLLDEIGDMPLNLQSKLLRVLQEGEVRRLGTTEMQKVDVRVIAATHRDLKKAVQEGQFRQDLLYRLEVISIALPPLRARKEDIIELAQLFLQRGCVRHAKTIRGFHAKAMQLLTEYSWPGNVRELANVVERAIVFAQSDEVVPGDLPDHLVDHLGDCLDEKSVQGKGKIEVPIGASLKDVEELLIRKTLEATSGDKNMTARLLGINSRTIYRKLDKRQ